MNFTFYILHFSLSSGAPRRKAGFTLIELLSVMGVMILITTIVVTSGFGLRRSAAFNSARQIPNNILEYAHQRACMDGRRTAVLFAPNGKDSDVFAASIFQASGSVADVSGDRITDVFSDIAEVPSGFNVLTVFNFGSGKTFRVGKIVKRDGVLGKTANLRKNGGAGGDATVDGETRSYYGPQIEITRASADKTSPQITSSSWAKNSAYGFEIADRQVLPKNFDYELESGGTKDGDSFWVVFRPDGSLEKGKIRINIKETASSPQKKLDPIIYE